MRSLHEPRTVADFAGKRRRLPLQLVKVASHESSAVRGASGNRADANVSLGALANVSDAAVGRAISTRPGHPGSNARTVDILRQSREHQRAADGLQGHERLAEKNRAADNSRNRYQQRERRDEPRGITMEQSRPRCE